MAGNPATPPCSIEAEKAVLGSILVDAVGGDGDRVIDLCLAAKVTPESFHDPRNRTIYEAMTRINAGGRPVDYVVLSETLRNEGKLEAIGGAGYLQGVVDSTPTSAHAEYYIGILRDKALRRTMIDRASKVISHSCDEDGWPDPQAVLGDAERSFLEIDAQDSGTAPWPEAVQRSFAELDAILKNGATSFDGLPTGLTHLDEKLRGLKNGEMIVIAARPSVGKTSLAMNIAECCALGRDLNNAIAKTDGGKKHPVMIFSLEMPIEALTRRMVAGRAQINTWRLNRDICGRSEKQTLVGNLFAAVDDLKNAPIYVDDAAGLDIMDLRARARRAKKRYGIELVVIDYLQLCTCRAAARQASRQIEVSMISQQIKAMAKELKIPVVVLSQLSRDNEKRGDKYEKPKLSDLRDSGAIEQDADVVFLLRRPSRNANDPESKDENLAIIDVAKNRNGETGEVRVNFYREFTRFGDREIERSGDGGVFSSSEPVPGKGAYVEDPNS